MFSFYELAGMATNLLAGLMGAKWGIKSTLLTGLSLQLVGIGMLFGWQVRAGRRPASCCAAPWLRACCACLAQRLHPLLPHPPPAQPDRPHRRTTGARPRPLCT